MNGIPVTYLNSNDGSGLLAFGNGPMLSLNESHTLEDLQSFIDKHPDCYLFLNLSYDLKAKIQGIKAQNPNYTEFPYATAWIPEVVVKLEGDSHTYVQGEQSTESDKFIYDFFLEKDREISFEHQLSSRLPREEYIQKVVALKNELQLGNIYEVNFCQEFYAESCEIDYPLATYFKWNRLTKAPFSAYVSLGNFDLFSGSPERFIKKEGNRIISSPIKGTRKRGLSSEEDEKLKTELLNDPKERAENVMIVDLVRNDLSRVATKNSVNVDELFGIYSFETVHQMISTISCEVPTSIQFTDILKATFPMGSMTGAPKISAMQLIEEHENFQRGIYSGAVGYIAPNGDFDFNVVIRTLIHNKEKRYLSCPVGGAITIQCAPEAEFEECNVKVRTILDGMHA